MKRRNTAAMGFMVILFFSIAAFTVSGISPDADAASYKRGSYGSTVSQIQQKLKDWGYYSAEVDGIYGSSTEKAVRYFQSKNGLEVDGVAGEQTLAALGMSSGSSSGGGYASNSENDVQLLARLISGEARGEPYTGQVAVGAVVLNRVDHPSFPNSISGVIYQSGAFDAVSDGQINMNPTDSCVRAAREALAGSDPSGGAIYYYNPATATSKWIWSREIICTIGKHNFAI
ncbi:MAG: spore cortex-lytic enzyme [Oscillospiraceae bacterium]|nr:spore cortex-lytic enzyme [Oscillospiraceae bacterium]